MNFVDKDNDAMPRTRLEWGSSHDVFDFFDAGEDGAEQNEVGFRESSDEASEHGFAAAGRSPEEHGTKIVGFDLDAKWFAGAEKIFLADEFVESARTHAFGEGLVGRGRVVSGECGEERHGKR